MAGPGCVDKNTYVIAENIAGTSLASISGEVASSEGILILGVNYNSNNVQNNDYILVNIPASIGLANAFLNTPTTPHNGISGQIATT